MISGREPVAGGDNRSCRGCRAPVTLLNTYTYNFRAMVQQFRGRPVDQLRRRWRLWHRHARAPVANLSRNVVRPPWRQYQQHRPAVTALLQQQLFRPQQYGNFGALLGGGGGGDMFLHGFQSWAEDRMLLQSIQVAQMIPRPVSTNNTNGYNIG